MKEHDSIDFIKGLVRQQRILIGILALSIGVALSVIFFAPKVYKVDSLLEIGTFPDGNGTLQPLEHPQQLIEKIVNGNYAFEVEKKISVSQGRFSELNAHNPEDTHLVQVEIYSSRPEIAKQVLTEVNTFVLADHQRKFDSKEESYTESIKALEVELRLNQGAFGAGSSVATVLSSQRVALSSAEPTVLIKQPAISVAPVNQKPILVIILALFIGLLFGIFAALGREWWLRGIRN